MTLLTSPITEGTVEVRGGRKIGYAEFGDPAGLPILWFHGTPGARRQIPEEARVMAAAKGVRIVGIDRPGIGMSTPYLCSSILDLTEDIGMVLTALGIDRFAVIGLSGGGPYALACGLRWPERVAAVAVLGGVAPTRGDDAVEGGPLGIARRAAGVLGPLEVPLTAVMGVMGRVIALTRPLSSPTFDLVMRLFSEGDQAVLGQPAIKEMFLDDVLDNGRRGLKAPVYDIILFTRPWGFQLGDLSVPVRWWHGDSDGFVPLVHAEHCVARIAGAELRVRPGESHLGAFGAAGEVLETLLELWS